MSINKWDLMDFALATRWMARGFDEGISNISFTAGIDVLMTPEAFDAAGFENVTTEMGAECDCSVSTARMGGVRFTCVRFPESEEEPEDGED